MQINLLTFTPPSESFLLDVYTEKAAGVSPMRIFRDDCPLLWEQNPKLRTKKNLYFSIAYPQRCAGDKYEAVIRFAESHRIAKHYFNHLIYNYFKKVAPAVGFDFVDNVEVWIKDTHQPSAAITQYLKFSLAPQFRKITGGWELLVSFNGASTVYNQSIGQLDIQTENYKVIAGHEVIKYKYLTPGQKQDIENIYPVIKHELALEFGLPKSPPVKENKYLKTYRQITDFAENYLLTADFQEIIRFHDSSFYSFDNPVDNKVCDDSNVLLFGKDQTGFDPYSGIRYNGPYQPSANNNIKFFFIHHQDDLRTCIRLHNIFMRSLNSDTNYEAKNPDGSPKYKPQDIPEGNSKTHPALWQFIRQAFGTDCNGSIRFMHTSTALQEIETQLDQKVLKKDCTYVAIYISPVRKEDVDHPQYNIYFAIKEMLLKKEITSQVIYKDNPAMPNFQYHIPNIYIALLAKTGGIPWQLKSDRDKKDLIIGIGAFKSGKIGKRFIGSAFCFSQEGVFQNFDCYRDNDLEHLTGDIRKAIGIYLAQNQAQKPERLIIYFYKTMGKKDSRRITDMLYSLGLKIPVYIITINKTESSDVVAFDTGSADLMPVSGTYVKVGNNQYLLYNNAKYPNSQKYDMSSPKIALHVKK